MELECYLEQRRQPPEVASKCEFVKGEHGWYNEYLNHVRAHKARVMMTDAYEKVFDGRRDKSSKYGETEREDGEKELEKFIRDAWSAFWRSQTDARQ